MSDCLTREFRAQLTTTMDSVMRRAMFEIMQIFENSLHDHQMQLAQKGEEIAHLKIKLQRTEIKLRETEYGGDRGAETNKTQMNEPQKEPEDVPNSSGQTSDVPEIDFEVPDDWCAPLGCDTVTKQDDVACPSVRLRSLYIPLWHIPIIPPIKQEVGDHDIESPQQRMRGRRSARVSLLKERHKHTQDRSSPRRDRGTRRPPVRNDMKKFLQDIKHAYTNPTGMPTGLRRGGRNLTGREQENTLRIKSEGKKIAATHSKSTKQETVEIDTEKRYYCKFCKKAFDTQLGRSVHVRSHKRCRGCKKVFPFPSALKCHKPDCAKLKKLLAKEAQSSYPPKPLSCDEIKTAAPRMKQLIIKIKKESIPSSSNYGKSSIPKDGSTKTHSCVHCNKEFPIRCRLNDHMRVHTGEKPFPCNVCPKKFRIKQSLKKHMMRMHKDQVNSSETNGDLAWTRPLEVIEDNREDPISPSKDVSRLINHNKVKRERDLDTKKGPRWQTMGTRCSKGFMCLLCQRVMKSKYMLIEHFCSHTGERLIRCDSCHTKFYSHKQLSTHKMKCRKTVIQREKRRRNSPRK